MADGGRVGLVPTNIVGSIRVPARSTILSVVVLKLPNVEGGARTYQIPRIKER